MEEGRILLASAELQILPMGVPLSYGTHSGSDDGDDDDDDDHILT
jgi:hypothetical protein